MSSLLFRHNLSQDSVERYLRGYEHDLPISAEDWAKAECLGLTAGTIVACLEAVSLTGSGAREQADSYKVSEVDFVVGAEEGRPIVVAVTAETYELTFLDTVMTRRAQDAKITGWDFYYLIVEPTATLSQATLEEIERIGMACASGGARREPSADGTAVKDPLIPLLCAVGLDLEPDARSRPLDIRALCYILFQDESAEAAQSIRRTRTCLKAVPRAGAAESLPERQPERPSDTQMAGVAGEPVEAGPDLAASAPAPAEGDDSEPHKAEETLLAQAADKPASGQDKPEPPVKPPGATTVLAAERAAAAETKKEEDPLKSLLGLGGIFSSFAEEPAASPEPARPGEATAATELAPAETAKAGPRIKLPRKEVAEAPQPEDAGKPPPLAIPRQQAQAPGTRAVTASEPAKARTPGQTGKAAPPSQPVSPAIPPPLLLPEAAAVSDPMSTLVGKLEQQVKKAASRLADHVDAIRKSLEEELKSLTDKAQAAEKEAEQALQSDLDQVFSELDRLVEEARLKIADASANARYLIKQSAETCQSTLGDDRKARVDEARRSCAQLKRFLETLAEAVRDKFDTLAQQRLNELNELFAASRNRLAETGAGDLNKIKTRFEQQRQRIASQAEAIEKTLEQHIEGLAADLETVCARAKEKLQSSRQDFRFELEQAAGMYKLDLERTIKSLLGASVRPVTRDQLAQLKKTVCELEARFAEECAADRASHRAQFESSWSALKSELNDLIVTRTSELEAADSEERTLLKATFEEASEFLDASTKQAAELFAEIGERLAETDKESRALVEACQSGAGPALTAGRDEAVIALNEARQAQQDHLSQEVDKRIKELDAQAQSARSAVQAAKEEHLASVRQAAQEAVEQVRAALQEAFQAIQNASKKHLE